MSSKLTDEGVEMKFESFQKIARLSRECVITEKIDGTNACILIGENGEFLTGSRTRWITPEDDNFGFSRWAHEHKDELLSLGVGRHFGEWWGAGIQRKYGLDHKRFSLFNTHKWGDDAVRPACCNVVPILAQGIFDTGLAANALESLRSKGSAASPGFMNPEGIIIFHTQGNLLFKKTLHKDDEWKGQTGILAAKIERELGGKEMSRKVWIDAQRKFQRERVKPAIMQLRRDFGLKAGHIADGLRSAFLEGFMQGYNTSNVMHKAKVKK